MNVRCKCCGKVIDKNEAIKVLGIKYNTYYCSKECAYFRDVIDNGIRITAEEKYIMEKLIFKICGLSNIEMFSLILSSNILLCVKSGHCHHYKFVCIFFKRKSIIHIFILLCIFSTNKIRIYN